MAAESTVEGARGLKLRAYRWEPSEATSLSPPSPPCLIGRLEPPAEPKRCELLVVHGYLEHAMRYDEMARYLAGRGVAVTAFDLRGHGRSEGARGYVERWDDYLDDVQAMLDPLPAPRFLLGHSMGGLIALSFAVQRRPAVAGLVVTNPHLEMALEVPAWKLLAGRFLGKVAPRATMPANLDVQLLTHDAGILEVHAQDPLILQNATAGWFREVNAAQQRLLTAERLDVAAPLLWVIGTADGVASPQASERVAGRTASPDKTVRKREGEYHEVLNEVHRATLFAEVGDWMLAHLGSPC